jgi:hypothetical protein
MLHISVLFMLVFASSLLTNASAALSSLSNGTWMMKEARWNGPTIETYLNITLINSTTGQVSGFLGSTDNPISGNWREVWQELTFTSGLTRYTGYLILEPPCRTEGNHSDICRSTLTGYYITATIQIPGTFGWYATHSP